MSSNWIALPVFFGDRRAVAFARLDLKRARMFQTPFGLSERFREPSLFQGDCRLFS
jgi:hypothetical protein